MAEKLVEEIPPPDEIRRRLAVHLQVVDLLRRLLKVSEKKTKWDSARSGVNSSERASNSRNMGGSCNV